MTASSLGGDWRRPSVGSVSPVARDGSSLVALLVVAGTVLATGSVRAVALAVPFLLVAIPAPSPVAFAAGQLAVLPTVTVEDTVAAAITQVALLAVLVEPARTRGSAYAAGATLVAYLGLVGLVVVSLPSGRLVAGGLLGVAVGCGTYLAHRVTLVRLGLVSEDEETDGGESGGRGADGKEPSGEETAGDRPADRPLTEAKE
jgi:hypothetical protein